MTVPTDIETRFWNKVEKTLDCWIWIGSLNVGGYGKISRPGQGDKCLLAHRISWELYNGPIPDGLEVCHHCDNPACVRPDHLFLGTQKDNLQDAIKKGRLNPAKCNQPSGENHGRAVLTVAQVKKIKETYSQKAGRYSRLITQRKLAKQFNISRRTIADILSGRTWQTALGV